MSKITLGNISTRRSTSSIDNYVGTIINSESGYSIPKIIQSTQLMKCKDGAGNRKTSGRA